MLDLAELDIGALEAITTPYRNALYHRSTIVEGIRRVAARNMVHLTRAMSETDHANDSRDVADKWVDDVQNRMLADQGLEESRANRGLIALATYLPVQVYLCLLYCSTRASSSIGTRARTARSTKHRR